MTMALLSSMEVSSSYRLSLFSLSLLLLGFFVYRLSYALLFSPLRSIPGPLAARLTSRRAHLEKFSGGRWAEEDRLRYGDVFVYKPNAVCVSHPEDVRAVLGSTDFRKTNFFDDFSDGSIPNIVSLRDPEKVSRRRRQLGQYFNPGYLGKMEDLILRHGYEGLRDKWSRQLEEEDREEVEINYRIDTQLATAEIMSAISFGRELGAMNKGNSAIIKHTTNLISLLGSRIVLALLCLLPVSLVMRPWKWLRQDLARFSGESLRIRRAHLDSGLPKPCDLLQAFLDSEDPASKVRLNPEEIRSESMMMMLAGSETTSSALAFTFHLFMLYPETLARAVSEVRNNFPVDQIITYKDVLSNLPYVEACVYEVLRQSPTTAGLTPRISPTRAITLRSGHIIPANTEVFVNLRTPSLDVEIWPEPKRFDPDRFLDEGAKKALFAFSYGPRNCIGKTLAWMELFTIVANVLKDWDFRLPDGCEWGPHNVDECGFPRMFPSKCVIASFPANARRDCRMMVKKRKVSG